MVDRKSGIDSIHERRLPYPLKGRRANFPLLPQGGSDKKYQHRGPLSTMVTLQIQAQVTPYPTAYLKSIAFKKLLVNYVNGWRHAWRRTAYFLVLSAGVSSVTLIRAWRGELRGMLTLKKLECSVQEANLNNLVCNNKK